MRYIKLLSLCTFLIFLSCAEEKPQEGFTLTGIMEDTKNASYTGYMYLGYGNTIDSAKVVDNKFVFTGKLEKPRQGWIYSERPYYAAKYVFLENSDITVKGKYYYADVGAEVPYHYYKIDTVYGSKSEELVSGFNKFREDNKHKENYLTMYLDSMKSMIRNNPKSPTLARLLSDDAIMNERIFNYDQLLELYQMLDTTYQNKPDLFVIDLGLNALKMNQIGAKFPEFNLVDTNDNLSTTSIFLGKKTLVDWWASWCGPCRKKHPKLKELYSKYKDKGFQIVSISIDEDKAPWINAYKKDELPWKNLWDEKQELGKMLGINGIPFNYLLDEQGEIILLNGSVKEIESKLLSLSE